MTKWPNTFKQFVGNLPTNCLSVFDHFVGLALKGLNLIACFIISISLLNDNLYTLHFSVLLFTDKKRRMKIANTIAVYSLAIHIHFSNIFLDFSRKLNLQIKVSQILRYFAGNIFCGNIQIWTSKLGKVWPL